MGPGLGDVDLRVGAKASLSFPTGDATRLLAAMSMVFAWCSWGPSTDATELTSVLSAVVAESIVSEAINGEDKVKSPVCD